MGFRHSRASLLSQLLELTVTQVAKQHARSLVRVLRQLALDFGVHVACYHENVGIAVVVEINDAGTPTDEPGLDCEQGGAGDVIEIPSAVIVIEAVGIIGKVRFKEIQMTIQIVVPCTDTHSGLLHAVVAECHSTEYTFLAKSPVMIIHEQ